MLILIPKKLQKNLTYHKPVLLQLTCDYLNVIPGERYIDATFGGGGHSAEIINRGGKVLTIDQDSDAGAMVQANFQFLGKIAKDNDWQSVSGILFDLGVSSHQFDTPERGFSTQKTGPLDMRMDQGLEIKATDLIDLWPHEQLAKMFEDYGEIPVAKSLAQKIVAARPIVSTGQLAEICGKWSQQVFQSLRIAVNDELGAIAAALPQALALLKPGGRLVVISFHSLEDRIVKEFFKENRDLGEILTPKPVMGEKNSKLRAFKKL